MNHIWQFLPDVCLAIVGTGEHAAHLRMLAKQSNHPDQILFLDEVRDQKGFLRCVDVYVQPSFSEAMSFDLLIAMAMERPVVASSIVNIHEIIESNASGLLVRPGSSDALASAIMRVFNDAELRITVSLNARTRVVQRFTIDQWHNATVALYRLI
jgi:glycosyltransferase involved in cell wall biosynthesis